MHAAARAPAVASVPPPLVGMEARVELPAGAGGRGWTTTRSRRGLWWQIEILLRRPQFRRGLAPSRRRRRRRSSSSPYPATDRAPAHLPLPQIFSGDPTPPLPVPMVADRAPRRRIELLSPASSDLVQPDFSYLRRPQLPLPLLFSGVPSDGARRLGRRARRPWVRGPHVPRLFP
jgi:hypothetical protein